MASSITTARAGSTFSLSRRRQKHIRSGLASELLLGGDLSINPEIKEVRNPRPDLSTSSQFALGVTTAVFSPSCRTWVAKAVLPGKASTPVRGNDLIHQGVFLVAQAVNRLPIGRRGRASFR